jgi:UDP-glucose 4-epimerase
MRVLITGGFGYVGGRLAQHLASKGYEVILATRNKTDSPAWFPTAKVLKINWDNPESINSSCQNIDIVVHAAGMNAQACQSDPIAALTFNGLCTAYLLDGAIAKGVKMFIYLSTAHVYASPLVGEIEEETACLNLHPYASSHYAGERGVLYANKNNLINGVVLRLSNAFGAPAHKDVDCWMLLVMDLCKQVISSQKIQLLTSGTQQRDFVTMHDVVNAISHMMELDRSSIGDGLFNLGSGNSVSVMEMAKYIGDRYAELYSLPPIVVTAPGSIEKVNNQTLRLQIDRILKTGFRFSGNKKNEIDDIIKFCSQPENL